MMRKLAFEAARREFGTLSERDVALGDFLGDRWGIPRDPGETAPQTPPQSHDRRRIGPNGLALIKAFEGLRLAAYKDAVGIWTIGYGSTGEHVTPGMTITRHEAEDLLRADLVRFEECVDRNCPDLNQNQFDACVSLAFNIGCGAFEKSSLCKLAKAGRHKLAKLQFARWVFAGGRKLNGLIRRRKAEAELYGRAM